MQSQWYKSRHSNANGTCLEAAFRKSNRSVGHGNCIEVALPAGMVLVRDSKDVTIPGLSFTPQSWSAFIGTIE